MLAFRPLQVIEGGEGCGDHRLGGAGGALLGPSGEGGCDSAGLPEGGAGEVGAGGAGGNVGDAQGCGGVLSQTVGGCFLRLDEAGVGVLGLVDEVVFDDVAVLGVVELGEDVGDCAGDVGEGQAGRRRLAPLPPEV